MKYIIFEKIKKMVLEGKTKDIKSLLITAVEQGITPFEIIHEVLIPSMEFLGELYYNDELFIPELLSASRTVHACLKFFQSQYKIQFNNNFLGIKVIIGTVAGDLHDIGKNIISYYLEANGFEVVNLGVDVTAEKFLEAIRKYKPDVLAMSALLTTTMTEMEKIIRRIEKAGMRDEIKIIVGGGPVTREYASKIGADGFGQDGKEAVQWLKQTFAIQ
ncbi:cobalamin B12-binding domain-containing protein [Carboxydothermus ferrireducens]|uniref:5-methyltetrahydrofolate--homocysteine methyltransferase n=1 Tax=Carboxydothermus ferrireducens DSM 11255 TaxID=1119529 RepID=A0ABX2RBG0_9THEO|nr:corrinoid protein [Carboxydothermus ferrireducens]NYE58519.1 5-methyltetrahydrofolate--homocysteine methyltransferase [Carboxydothermus ferrireducens DSM 11255]